MFTVRLSFVHHTHGVLCRRAHRCSPWAVLESLTVAADRTDNKHETVTILHSCQKNINDMGYKQRPLISERPHDFKKSDSSRLVGPVGAGQGKYDETTREKFGGVTPICSL